MTTSHSVPRQAVASYTGDVTAEALGRTLIHEHLFVGDPELERALPHPEWDEAAAIETAVTTLEQLVDAGVRTVVDLTVPGLGRDVARVAKVAARTRMQIIAATGWYTPDVLPNELRLRGPGRLVDEPDPLVDLFRKDITQGIAGTRVRAGVIKITSDTAGITPDIHRVFAAAARVHHETGTPIITHSAADNRGGVAQQQLLRELGVDLERVVIGHCGDSTDLAYLEQIAEAGSYLGFDRFGMAHAGSDEDRLRTLLTLVERGYADRIVISQDAAIFSRITPPSWRQRMAPNWHLQYLTTTVLPRLQAAGVSPETLDRLLIDNPRRILTGMG